MTDQMIDEQPKGADAPSLGGANSKPPKDAAGVANVLNRAADTLREAGADLDLGPQYRPGVGWVTGHRQAIRAMISSIEYLAKELVK